MAQAHVDSMYGYGHVSPVSLAQSIREHLCKFFFIQSYQMNQQVTLTNGLRAKKDSTEKWPMATKRTWIRKNDAEDSRWASSEGACNNALGANTFHLCHSGQDAAVTLVLVWYLMVRVCGKVFGIWLVLCFFSTRHRLSAWSPKAREWTMETSSWQKHEAIAKEPRESTSSGRHAIESPRPRFCVAAAKENKTPKTAQQTTNTKQTTPTGQIKTCCTA